MVVCPKCRADNQIGAIFCRECGDKLEIEEVALEDVKRKSDRLKRQRKIKAAINSTTETKNII